MYQSINNKMEFNYIPINNKNLETIITNKEYRKQLYKLLEEELSPQQFKCINLYYGAGFERELIAQELNISKQAVHSYLKDAYNKIIYSENIICFLNDII